MNINNSIIKSSGISLGNLELASEYLYGDSTLYEPELTDIKRHENINKDIKKHINREIHIENTNIDEIFSIDLDINIEDNKYITGDIDKNYGVDIWDTSENSDEVIINKSSDKEENKTDTDNMTTVETADKHNYTREDILEFEDEADEYEIDTDKYEIDYSEHDEMCIDGETDNEDCIAIESNNIISDKPDILNKNNGYTQASYSINETHSIHREHKEEGIKYKESNIENNYIDSLINKVERRKNVEPVNYESKGVNYSELEVNILAEYMRKFLKCHGVSKGPVDIEIVAKEFGSYNVNRLLKKCYIIKIERGVTIGI